MAKSPIARRVPRFNLRDVVAEALPAGTSDADGDTITHRIRVRLHTRLDGAIILQLPRGPYTVGPVRRWRHGHSLDLDRGTVTLYLQRLLPVETQPGYDEAVYKYADSFGLSVRHLLERSGIDLPPNLRPRSDRYPPFEIAAALGVDAAVGVSSEAIAEALHRIDGEPVRITLDLGWLVRATVEELDAIAVKRIALRPREVNANIVNVSATAAGSLVAAVQSGARAPDAGAAERPPQHESAGNSKKQLSNVERDRLVEQYAHDNPGRGQRWLFNEWNKNQTNPHIPIKFFPKQEGKGRPPS